MAEELKPCAHCGGKAMVNTYNDDIKFPFIVECSECGSSSNLHPERRFAVMAWNRRAALRSTETEPSQEPVAWCRSDSFTIHYWSSSERPPNSTGDIHEWKPLYASPRPDREAEENERLRALIRQFSDVADFMDLETEGFDMSDKLALVYKNEDDEEVAHITNFDLRVFYECRAALAKEGK